MNGMAKSISTNLTNQFGPIVDKVKDCIDVLKAGKDVVSTVVKDVTGENITIQDIQQGAADFDTKWDAFAEEVNKKFNSTSQTNQTNILEAFAKSHFDQDIYNLGSAVKNEMPGVLEGVAEYKNAMDVFDTDTHTLETTANKIKTGTEKIVAATEKVAGSLNNAITTCTGNGMPILASLSSLGGTTAVQNLNKVLGIGSTGASIATTGNQLKKAIKKGDIRGITEAMSKGADTINNLLSQLNHSIPIIPNVQIPSQITNSIKRLQNGQAIYDAAGSMVTSLIVNAAGAKSLSSVTSLLNNFGSDWDNFSAKIDALFQVVPSNGQQAVLESLVKNMFGSNSSFGDNVFYAGGCIKRQLPGVLDGISGIKDAYKQFGGSYRNPIEAAKKIRNGVEKMVQSVEKIGKSLNDMVKWYQGKGNLTNGTGNPLLDTMEHLGDLKGIKALDTTLRIGAGGAAVVGNARELFSAIKDKDIKGAVAAVKKTINDVKSLTKKGLSSSATNASAATNAKNNATTQLSNGQQVQSDLSAGAGSDSYVCSGAIMKCTMGEQNAKLTVLPTRTVFLTGQPMANISDHASMVNLAPFGKCRSLGYPATASATAAHHGVLTPMPCVHNTPMPWMNGKNDYLIKGQPALLKSCKCTCMWGGVISIINDGQNTVGVVDLSREPLAQF